MHLTRRACALISSAVITVPLALGTTTAAQASGSSKADVGDSAQVVIEWQRILNTTVYPAMPIPNGVPLLGYTSMAMLDAVDRSLKAGDSSETAAVATAAHDVLVHYFPAQKGTLDARLATSLASVGDADEKARGSFLGAASASLMLASRVGDGFGDTSIHYTLPPGIGVWQPIPPTTDMLAAWLGSVDPLVLRRPIRVNGPDKLTSRGYAKDFAEVKRLGGNAATGSERTQEQTDIAVFFNGNAATMIPDALGRNLEASGALTIRGTALVFARIHAAMADSIIQSWRLKRDLGFWRPFEAIQSGDLDGNPATTGQANWEPLIGKPPYSDYVSGHASLTGPAAEVVRRTLGDKVTLEMISGTTPVHRTYTSLKALEFDAFHARIWGGLHFRDAMDDGYRIGHLTARHVMADLR
ncbi:hypothetical protein N802_05180 [Knoellia sinensis KCTC 19936]|uniref:Phosphatidic acid phosphatase type 2/haloperoxidase domain-containing protein n=1 Tax=Knoellia sinensis KCTC 19936 TaxID=1385520 RepID=A0A0A0J1R1_9MICO|nr:vanadium-dependent haloperoxidase [Knoellia sinensis]KGN30998.1 hypothetical protein N802_05180 [Knoellia sinensis KCTC 19936]